MHALRLSVAAVVAAILAMTTGAVGCFSNDRASAWFCRDPATGMLDYSNFDLDHYVNDVFDPCHCMDPGGPRPTCPDVADAGAD